MAVFAFAKLSSPLALAIKAFGEYFSWPAEVADIKYPRPIGKVLIKVVEAGATDAQTMRYIEKMRDGRERPILLFSPEPEPGPIGSILQDMPNLFFIPSNATADDLIASLAAIIGEVESNRRFFIDAESAEDSYLNHRYMDALNAAKRMLASEYQPFIPHMIIGRTLFMSDRIHPALQHGKKALTARPTSMPAASLVAAAHQKLGQSHLAEKYLVKFLPQAETSVMYMVQLGDVYFENGKIPDAKATYKKANSLEPEAEGALKGLLAVSILEGDLRASKQIMMGPLAHFDLGRFCNLRAIALTNNKQFKNAEKLYLNTVNLLGKDRNLYKLYFNLGLCMKKAGNVDKSIKYFDMCERMAPRSFSRVTQQLKKLRGVAAPHKLGA
jgi:tetratricopeptide (TPR) repeat protein